jgi:hypothetical protein
MMLSENIRLRLRSQVLKAGLPRPNAFCNPALFGSKAQYESVEEQAVDLIQAELASILIHDAESYPQAKAQPPPYAVPQGYDYDIVSERDLEVVDALIAAELGEKPQFDSEALQSAWEASHQAYTFSAKAKRYVRSDEQGGNEAVIAALRMKFDVCAGVGSRSASIKQ